MKQNLDLVSGDFFVVTLVITTYSGLSIGAIHYYGVLYYHDEKTNLETTEVNHKLTVAEARHLRKLDSEYGYSWRAGEITSRFETREDVIKSAYELFKKLFSDRENAILVVGQYAAVSPKLIISANKPNLINKYYLDK